jgi:hypothetical protein
MAHLNPMYKMIFDDLNAIPLANDTEFTKLINTLNKYALLAQKAKGDQKDEINANIASFLIDNVNKSRVIAEKEFKQGHNIKKYLTVLNNILVFTDYLVSHVSHNYDWMVGSKQVAAKNALTKLIGVAGEKKSRHAPLTPPSRSRKLPEVYGEVTELDASYGGSPIRVSPTYGLFYGSPLGRSLRSPKRFAAAASSSFKRSPSKLSPTKRSPIKRHSPTKRSPSRRSPVKYQYL